MTMTFKDFLEESINDKGLFKAVFVVGFPGSGKSYTIKRLHGTVSPRVVNTDRATEFIGKKVDKATPDEAERETQKSWSNTGSRVKRMTRVMLSQYLVNMLPLFIDGTSARPDHVMERVEMLRKIGYDVGVIFLHCDSETAKKRVVDRVSPETGNRKVDPSHIDRAEAALAKAREAFSASNFDFFRQYKTDVPEFNNEVMDGLQKVTQAFFNTPVKNPVGKKIIDDLESLDSRVNKEKYLVPKFYSQNEIDSIVDAWFPSGGNR